MNQVEMTSMIGKPLHDAIKNIDCNVKIGAKNGFVFCGKPTAIELHEVDAGCIERYENNIERTKKELRALLSELQDLKTKIETKQERLYQKQDALKERHHLLKRKVISIYKSIDEDDTWIMLVEGDEQGDFWTTNEYESKEVIDCE